MRCANPGNSIFKILYLKQKKDSKRLSSLWEQPLKTTCNPLVSAKAPVDLTFAETRRERLWVSSSQRMKSPMVAWIQSGQSGFIVIYSPASLADPAWSPTWVISRKRLLLSLIENWARWWSLTQMWFTCHRQASTMTIWTDARNMDYHPRLAVSSASSQTTRMPQSSLETIPTTTMNMLKAEPWAEALCGADVWVETMI